MKGIMSRGLVHVIIPKRYSVTVTVTVLQFLKRIIGLFSLSHEQNKARFNYAVARKQRRMPI